MTVWFTSDTHFGHANVIKFCDRPYKTVEEMDEGLVKNWNWRVQPKDTIYHLGDFCLGNEANALQILKRLNGRKVLIKGNHDHRGIYKSPEWAEMHSYLELRGLIENKLLVLCHFPFAIWNQSHRGAINLHGHSHGSYKGNSQQLDVGVDVHHYVPISLDDITGVLKAREALEAKDHHRMEAE